MSMLCKVRRKGAGTLYSSGYSLILIHVWQPASAHVPPRLCPSDRHTEEDRLGVGDHGDYSDSCVSG